MNAQLISKSFRMIGIKKECLFKNFNVALLEAKTKFNKVIPANLNESILIVYEMTTEELHPDRAEIFYYGIMMDETSGPHDGMELIHIVNQSFVMTTHLGVISEIWKGYNTINEFMKGNSLDEDKTSYAVELYDRRFNLESDKSEMEIYIPVKSKCEVIYATTN